MKRVYGECPLGSKCEQVRDDEIVTCPWYIKVQGKDPQSDQYIDEWRCSMAWLPMLMIEHSLFERQTGAAVESFRNEMKKDNNNISAAMQLMSNATRSIEHDS